MSLSPTCTLRGRLLSSDTDGSACIQAKVTIPDSLGAYSSRSWRWSRSLGSAGSPLATRKGGAQPFSACHCVRVLPTLDVPIRILAHPCTEQAKPPHISRNGALPCLY